MYGKTPYWSPGRCGIAAPINGGVHATYSHFAAHGKVRRLPARIADGVYEALRETFNVPEHDFFATIAEHRPQDFVFDRTYFDIERSDDFVIVEMTVSNTRTIDQKKALYRRIVERLAKNPGLRPQDVFINLVEVVKENWSFGLGQAQYV
jgi:4-oxalocrotonate tautomerase